MVLFLDLSIFVIAVLLIIFMVTQLFWPMYTGEPLFPFFRKSVVKTEIVKTEGALEEVASVEYLKHISDELQRRTAQLEKKE